MKLTLAGLLMVILTQASFAWACAGTGQVCTESSPCCSPNDQCVGRGDPNHYRGVCITRNYAPGVETFFTTEAGVLGSCYALPFCRGTVMIRGVTAEYCASAGGHSQYSSAFGCQTF